MGYDTLDMGHQDMTTSSLSTSVLHLSHLDTTIPSLPTRTRGFTSQFKLDRPQQHVYVIWGLRLSRQVLLRCVRRVCSRQEVEGRHFDFKDLRICVCIDISYIFV